MATSRCSVEGISAFTITAVFARTKDIASKRSFVKEVHVEYRGHTAVLGQNMAAYYDGRKVRAPLHIRGSHSFDFVSPTFTHHKDFPRGTTVVLSVIIPTGHEVQFDGVKSVKVIAPPFSLHAGRTCGLCGNNDGVLDQGDWTTGNHNNDLTNHEFGDVCKGLQSNAEPYKQTVKNVRNFVTIDDLVVTG
ncbi:hypothetical protein CAPTEDRAFT_197425 [Capitella teleta]|uniref:VWFD domain-containing protein n=1 Tax=Capitella teleta TaxID=283909 RepID=R7TZ62_CAPTE|nr:hypothetical protein CAPTEDRAFT_197425 [Capitella teleta]|eukprot:ELT99044.1 hypothetical protein CAPTEDRAFT_197425 [Capitella teleta]